HVALLLSLHAPPTTDIYTLSLHDALPIYVPVAPWELAPAHLDICATHNSLGHGWFAPPVPLCGRFLPRLRPRRQAMRSFFCGMGDRKSTRLNSSHVKISYAVFCLKKKNET